MLLKEGVTVVNAQGDKVGELGQVVIDPVSKEVTHVIIRKGFLFKEDRVAPVDMLQSGDEGRLVLNILEDNLDNFPNYVEREFIRVGDDETVEEDYQPVEGYPPQMFWYPTMSGSPVYRPGYFGAYPPTSSYEEYSTIEERNIPEDTVPLKEGARVISADGEHVGDLEEVILQENSDKATHFVVSQGILFTEEKLLPMHWVRYIREDEVHLGVEARFIEDLPAYNE